eukprot:13850235-Alexandrium_andersonii.AAC.1
MAARTSADSADQKGNAPHDEVVHCVPRRGTPYTPSVVCGVPRRVRQRPHLTRRASCGVGLPPGTADTEPAW